MVLRNPGRLLAPVALVAVLVAVIVVTNSDLGKHHAASAPPRVQAPAVFHRSTPTTSYYVIKAGDSLSAISAKTGVSLPQLEALNPSVDPNALQTGRRLRLRP
jgi:LysM repeat protein